MDKVLKPHRLDIEPDQPNADREWNHWYRTFTNFVTALSEDHSADKLSVLINYVSPRVYEFIAESSSYDEAIAVLQSCYVKPKNEVYARHKLASRKQESSETLDSYLNELKLLSRDGNYKAVSATTYRDESIRDSFIAGLKSSYIRQRLLETKSLTLQEAFDKARALEAAQLQADNYNEGQTRVTAASYTTTECSPSASIKSTETSPSSDPLYTPLAVVGPTRKCYFCGFSAHPRVKCPAKDATCRSCSKQGHFAKVCKSKSFSPDATSAASLSTFPSTIATIIASAPSCLRQALLTVTLNGISTKALVDTGSSESFISFTFAKTIKTTIVPSTNLISMATTSLSTSSGGHCFVSLCYDSDTYSHVKFNILKNLCADVILGHDILNKHKSVEVIFDGAQPPLKICGLTAASVTPPLLFANLTKDCSPVADRSRRYSSDDRDFIRREVKHLLSEGIIEPSTSPWRAQVLITGSANTRKRMVVDYSRTINRFTLLDAYPLPRIDDMIRRISQYRIYSTLDLKSAYHQIPLIDKEKIYTAFEAEGRLYQFKRIPFGVTNGVACFQRIIDSFIDQEKLTGTFAYLDNVTLCGSTQQEHDATLDRFLSVAKANHLTFNHNKSTLSATSINLLGYQVSHGLIKPDPERLRPFKELEEPQNVPTLKRVLGLFSYYSQWVPRYSEVIYPLAHASTFPLSSAAVTAFKTAKAHIESAVLTTIDNDVPFVVETDASNHAIAATLNQAGRPVAFFSRTLSKSEQNHSSIEKEAYAIVESLRKWRHFLIGRHFRLLTDQRSVAFMFDGKTSGKIKNEKIMRWRIELSSYCYDIIYRPGSANPAADALSRSHCSAIPTDKLLQLHINLCHPGVVRMIHFVRCRNLPYSVDDVKRMVASCTICSKLKPNFYKPPPGHLIKSTQPFERLNVDFKGPLPSSSRNKYLLTIVDEYSRFPFAFPCSDTSSATVIRCLTQLFTMFGMPSYLHSDQGSSFMSSEIKTFLSSHGISSSRTTPYNPQGNGQVERYNGIIWKAVLLALESRNLKVEQWEIVLADALHSIRTLLSTATNSTPHERLFKYIRKSSNGCAVPSWLSMPGKVLLKRAVRHSKHDPLVDEVQLIEANPNYAHVRLPDGRETTVSVRHLAPCSSELEATDTFPSNLFEDDCNSDENDFMGFTSSKIRSSPEATTSPTLLPHESTSTATPPSTSPATPPPTSPSPPLLRRSSRISKIPDRLQVSFK